MSLMDLILVMSGAAFEYDLQRDVEVSLVYFTSQIRHDGADAEKDGSLVTSQVGLAGRDHFLDRRRRMVVEREINHVSQ